MDVGTYSAPSPVLVDSGVYPDPNGNYSYTFNAYSQEIDHIVMTARANQDFVRISHAHGNADASDSADTTNTYGALMLDPTTAVRTSDHDGQVVTLGYEITLSSTIHGTINPAQNLTVSKNTQPTITINPDPGYVAVITDSCVPQYGGANPIVVPTNIYKLNPVIADCRIDVKYMRAEVLGNNVPITNGDANPDSSDGTQFGDVALNSTITHNFTVQNQGTSDLFIGSISIYYYDYTLDPSLTFPIIIAPGASVAIPILFKPTLAQTEKTTVSIFYGLTAAGAYYGDFTYSFDIEGTGYAIGSCGSANGVTSGQPPDFQNLCSSGYQSAVSSTRIAEGIQWSWTCNGSPGYSSASCSALQRIWTVTPLSGIGGKIFSSEPQSASEGQTVQFLVTADNGYSVAGVTGCDGQLTLFDPGHGSYTTAPLTQNCTVSATFNYTPGYVPLNPSRILDTRAGANTSDGQFAAEGALGPGHTLDLIVLGRGGVAATGVKAVVLNLTVTDPTTAGYVTAWPSGEQMPGTSNINFVAGQTIPNLVIVKVGSNGKVALSNSSGNTQLVADVLGYFTDAAAFNAISPARLLDTRPGYPTIDGLYEGLGPVTEGDAGKVDLRMGDGRGGLPDFLVNTAILNVTVTNPTAPGYITVWPTGSARPMTSNLNFIAGQTIANLVVSKIGVNEGVSFYNSAGSTDLIVDVIGWLPTGSELTSVQPARLLDTRLTGTTIDGQFQHGGPLGPQGVLDFTVAGRGNVPSSGVGAVVLNVTVTDPTTPGYVTAWPTGSARPIASNLNFMAGDTVPNLVIVKVGDQGKVSLYNSQGNSYIVADVVGWFPASE